jgi:hypothetical protein
MQHHGHRLHELQLLFKVSIMTMAFSEFSYGYAFTENLIRSSATAPTSAPKFPSLIEEGRGVGWDVNIELPGKPLFFQFKVGRLLKRSSAREIARGIIPGLTVPYMRLPITRRDWSTQHSDLVKLEGSFPNSVFYASPLISTQAEFNTAYSMRRVHLESVLFSPAAVGLLPDDLSHHIVYKGGQATAWFCSEPQKLDFGAFAALSDRLHSELAILADQPLRKTAVSIKEGLLEILPSNLRSSAADIEEQLNQEMDISPSDGGATAIALATAQKIARVAFGVELFVAQPRA